MKVKFTNIKIHGFLSFGDAELDLNDRGYTLVSGVNNNPKDLALSNGSGKSSIWSAISYALFGETIQGLSSNICNLYLNDGCFVDLTFYIDETKYNIIRYKDYRKIGTDLKIYVNDEDKSGKGIRESQKLLNQYLPDLTSDLLGSVIILGQGLPHKFSNNTPAGRKEVLEKLSKSDFMIEDIKLRLADRTKVLNSKVREQSDQYLIETTQLNMIKSNLANYNSQLANLTSPDDSIIESLCNQLESHNNNCLLLQESMQKLYIEKEDLNKDLMLLIQEKNNEESKIRSEFDFSDLNKQYSDYEAESYSLKREINNLKNIKDVCPTCGQHLPNVVKPDTSEQEKRLKELESILIELNNNINDRKAQLNESLNTYNNLYNSKYSELNLILNNKKKEYLEQETKLRENNNIIRQLNIDIDKLKLQKSNYESTKANLQKSIIDAEINIKNIEEKILYINNEKENLEQHLKVIDKISTLVKRDFRGFLLTNVIEYINAKAKEYCIQVFDTNEIDFKLNGNNIDITFCGKYYENLSGGEKQKVDLILQFSLRNMLCQYLDFSSNILVLDEIFDNLDSIGCDKILNLISNTLNDIESIFIISHHTFDLNIPYDSEIVVEKNSDGISRIK